MHEKNGTRVLRIERIYADVERFFGLLLKKMKVRNLEKCHKKGYAKRPVEKGEFDLWQDEQAWLE